MATMPTTATTDHKMGVITDPPVPEREWETTYAKHRTWNAAAAGGGEDFRPRTGRHAVRPEEIGSENTGAISPRRGASRDAGRSLDVAPPEGCVWGGMKGINPPTPQAYATGGRMQTTRRATPRRRANEDPVSGPRRWKTALSSGSAA